MKTGFTLIELLVVVLIIGILAAVALPQYQRAVDKARFVQLQTAMDSLKKSNELYFLANGSYATDFDTFDIPSGCTLTTNKSRLACSWGGCYNNNEGSNYGCSITLSHGDQVIFEHFPRFQMMQCLAVGDTVSPTSRSYQLCNSMPHTTPPYTGGCSQTTCYRFILK